MGRGTGLRSEKAATERRRHFCQSVVSLGCGGKAMPFIQALCDAVSPLSPGLQLDYSGARIATMPILEKVPQKMPAKASSCEEAALVSNRLGHVLYP